MKVILLFLARFFLHFKQWPVIRQVEVVLLLSEVEARLLAIGLHTDADPGHRLVLWVLQRRAEAEFRVGT